jgi:hypothetical protein
MTTSLSFLEKIQEPLSVITTIDKGIMFPDIMDISIQKYREDIGLFQRFIQEANSSEELLKRIRSEKMLAKTRMSLLKIFRRCVSPVCDTETTKKITKIPTANLIKAYGNTFKPIEKLKIEFGDISPEILGGLAVLLGEYDSRGYQGYELTALFFDWFEKIFESFEIAGPRQAGRDIEFSSIFPEFTGRLPCDFFINEGATVLAVGFARYDSTRGGAQSDDRTGGNSNKVTEVRHFCTKKRIPLKIIFLADGPGLVHRDTWEEACSLDGSWDDRVRVTTLKLASERIAKSWLTG